MSHREPTIPGVFRDTLDPFLQMNSLFTDMFGLSDINKGSITEESSLQNSNADSGSRLKLSVSEGELTQSQHITQPGSPEQRKGDSLNNVPSWPPQPQVRIT